MFIIKVVGEMSAFINNLLKVIRTSRFYEKAKKNKLLRSVKNKIDQRQFRKMQEGVHIYGLDMLKIMKESFDEINHEFWLDYGTLLGAIRDKDFIGHDDDLDIGTFDLDNETKKKLSDILVSKGMKRFKRYEMDGIIIEEAFRYNDTHIDIFYYHRGENKTIWCYFCDIGPKMEFQNFPDYQLAKGYRTHKVTSRFEGLMPYNFKGEVFNIPSNYDEYLKDNYGESYMIKMENWDSEQSSPNIEFVGTDKVLVKEYI